MQDLRENGAIVDSGTRDRKFRNDNRGDAMMVGDLVIVPADRQRSSPSSPSRAGRGSADGGSERSNRIVRRMPVFGRISPVTRPVSH